MLSRFPTHLHLPLPSLSTLPLPSVRLPLSPDSTLQLCLHIIPIRIVCPLLLPLLESLWSGTCQEACRLPFTIYLGDVIFLVAPKPVLVRVRIVASRRIPLSFLRSLRYFRRTPACRIGAVGLGRRVAGCQRLISCRRLDPSAVRVLYEVSGLSYRIILLLTLSCASFTFKWPRFSDDFHRDARDMLEAALNKGNKPPIIADRIEVIELEMGTQAGRNYSFTVCGVPLILFLCFA